MLRELNANAVHAYASCSGETRRGAVRCGGEGGGWRWEEAHEVRGLAAAPAGACEKPAGQLDVWGRQAVRVLKRESAVSIVLADSVRWLAPQARLSHQRATRRKV